MVGRPRLRCKDEWGICPDTREMTAQERRRWHGVYSERVSTFKEKRTINLKDYRTKWLAQSLILGYLCVVIIETQSSGRTRALIPAKKCFTSSVEKFQNDICSRMLSSPSLITFILSKDFRSMEKESREAWWKQDLGLGGFSSVQIKIHWQHHISCFWNILWHFELDNHQVTIKCTRTYDNSRKCSGNKNQKTFIM